MIPVGSTAYGIVSVVGKSGRMKRGKSVEAVAKRGVRIPTAPPTIKHTTRPPRNVPIRETAERTRAGCLFNCDCFFCDYDRGLDSDDAKETEIY